MYVRRHVWQIALGCNKGMRRESGWDKLARDGTVAPVLLPEVCV